MEVQEFTLVLCRLRGVDREIRHRRILVFMSDIKEIVKEIEELDEIFRKEGIPQEYKDKWNVDINVGIWATGRKTAELLHQLVLENKPQLILELGTSVGYSTLFLADAARVYGGKITTIDREEYKVEEAKEYLRRAGLDANVDFLHGEIDDYLESWDKNVDFLFFDANKRGYLEQLQVLEPFLIDGAVIVADNIADFPEQTKDFVEYVTQNPAYDSEVLDIDHGVLVATYSAQ
jgi:predicted O-methyltransferase YrrM